MSNIWQCAMGMNHILRLVAFLKIKCIILQHKTLKELYTCVQKLIIILKHNYVLLCITQSVNTININNNSAAVFIVCHLNTDISHNLVIPETCRLISLSGWPDFEFSKRRQVNIWTKMLSYLIKHLIAININLILLLSQN